MWAGVSAVKNMYYAVRKTTFSHNYRDSISKDVAFVNILLYVCTFLPIAPCRVVLNDHSPVQIINGAACGILLATLYYYSIYQLVINRCNHRVGWRCQIPVPCGFAPSPCCMDKLKQNATAPGVDIDAAGKYVIKLLEHTIAIPYHVFKRQLHDWDSRL